MKIDKLNNRHILADEGKVLRRISDGQLFGNEIYLGYTYYLSGEELPEPLLELPEHYEGKTVVLQLVTGDENAWMILLTKKPFLSTRIRH